jgi:transposase-like protein
VYWWADGVYSNVRMDDRLCLLVIIGVTEQGRKELVAVEDGYRESEASWSELLLALRERGLTTSPKLAIGDCALGFWKALAKCYPDTRHQRCWVHKTANIMSALPKSVQPKVKAALHDIWMAETQDDAHKALDRALVRFESKYPGAMERLRKDRDELLESAQKNWKRIKGFNLLTLVVNNVKFKDGERVQDQSDRNAA